MAYSFEDIQNSVTVVTGGARGIGYSIAKLFGEHSSKIVIVDIDEDAAKNSANEIEKLGVEASGYSCDISNYSQVEKVMGEIVEKFGSIDCLVNNAGITKDGLFMRMKPEDWQRVLDINLTGTFNCTRVAINYMRKVKKGSIINISSISAQGNPGQTNYSASKSGVVGFTSALGKEVAKMGIRVNAVAPGFVKSDMTDKMPEKAIDFLLSMTPMGRPAQPEEIANVVLFLASNLSSFVTAKTYYVDGGMF